MSYLKQREERMASEAQENSYKKSYRKKFPKGKDWKTPKKNPYGFCGLNESSYHGMETVAISIEKHNELKEELEQLKNDIILVLEINIWNMKCYEKILVN